MKRLKKKKIVTGEVKQIVCLICWLLSFARVILLYLLIISRLAKKDIQIMVKTKKMVLLKMLGL